MTLPHLTWLQITGIVCLVIIVGSIYRSHRDPKSTIDLFDLLQSNGQLDLVKTMGTAGYLIMGYVILTLLDKAKLTEGYLSIFATGCVAPLVVEIIRRTVTPTEPPRRDDDHHEEHR